MILPVPASPAAVAAYGRALHRRYPALSIVSIGQSVCGRSIDAYVLGRDASRIVLVAAAVHAQEWLTSLVALRLLEALCRLGEPRDRAVVILPQVNPDGVAIALSGARSAPQNRRAWLRSLGSDVPGRWQANARGVDLNHNFNAGWKKLQELEQKIGIVGPAPRRFGGFSPESEPETRAVCDLCRRVRVSQLLALHSQGEEIYWQYGDRTPKEARAVAEMLAALSGYRVASPEPLATGGGMKDWFIEQYGRFGFTLELGRGVNPLPADDLDPIWDKTSEMLLAFATL
ncbi:MAG: M14 family metallocarboxypeptidase [Clostridia bacterium]|nr:M14 family metallocarboxypeptidase [Clostridia bacterium]